MATLTDVPPSDNADRCDVPRTYVTPPSRKRYEAVHRQRSISCPTRSASGPGSGAATSHSPRRSRDPFRQGCIDDRRAIRSPLTLPLARMWSTHMAGPCSHPFCCRRCWQPSGKCHLPPGQCRAAPVACGRGAEPRTGHAPAFRGRCSVSRWWTALAHCLPRAWPVTTMWRGGGWRWWKS